MRKTKTLQRGFSLIEIMVVVVIIGLLASVATVGVMRYLTQARITTATSQMKEFVKALDLYKMDKAIYPTSGEGLEALTKSDGKKPLLKEIPKDPWGRKYVYNSTGSSFEIISYGADKREGGQGEAADIKMKSD